MPSARPINPLNAIDAAAFIIAFDREFSETEEKRLLKLKELLKDDLPEFTQDIRVKIKKEPDTPPVANAEKAGVNLMKISDGKVLWKLNVRDRQITISCHDYDRWGKVWKKAAHYIEVTLEALGASDLKVQSCGLQYIDRFVEAGSTYDLKNVFCDDSEYLSPSTYTAGRFWHPNQGWFDQLTNKKRVLNTLNLNTDGEIDSNIVTTIDHAIFEQYLELKELDNFRKNKQSRSKLFLSLHNRNKEVVNSLLREKQKLAIKLNG